jgi:hypothetical protein
MVDIIPDIDSCDASSGNMIAKSYSQILSQDVISEAPAASTDRNELALILCWLLFWREACDA